MFEADEINNLYKVWNRMSAGSYMPGPVRAVEIPKDHGAGIRVLGVPNTADRIAQTAAACCWRKGWSRSSTETVTAIVPGEVPMTRWPYAEGAAGSRTGYSIWMSGPFSTAFPHDCY